MDTTNKEFPPENKIGPSGWTMPEDVVGEMPPQRPEVECNLEALADLAWGISIENWNGARFALFEGGQWSTGQQDLFGGSTTPEGSWPKRCLLTPTGEALDVRPWRNRPPIGSTFPTPVSYDATPGGPGNHYKGLGHQAKHGDFGGEASFRGDGKLWATPQHHDSKSGKAECTVRGTEEGASGGYRNLNDEVLAFPEAPAMFPTPRVAGMGESVETWQARQDRRKDNNEAPFSMPLGVAVRISAAPTWPTPRASEAKGLPGVDTPSHKDMLDKHYLGATVKQAEADGVPLGQHPRTWTTPMSSEGRHGTAPIGSRSHTTELSKKYLGAQVREAEQGQGKTRMWPTPIATDAEKMPSGSLSRAVDPQLPWSFRTNQPGDPRDEFIKDPNLPQDPKMWPTATASDAQPRRKSENWAGNDLVSTVTEIEEDNGAIVARSGGQLNPDWVEPLMGYRCLNTDLAPEAAAWFKIDAKRLKASDLKKLHAMDEHEEPDVVEAVAEEVIAPVEAPNVKKNKRK